MRATTWLHLSAYLRTYVCNVTMHACWHGFFVAFFGVALLPVDSESKAHMRATKEMTAHCDIIIQKLQDRAVVCPQHEQNI